MTNGDIMFLQRIVDAHKEVIREDCERKKLGAGVCQSRIHKAERRAMQILNGLR